MKELFLELDNISFTKGASVEFHDISWKIFKEEHWAIVGPVGSGKSILAEAIIGSFFLREGKINYYFLASATTGAKSEIAYLSFSENSAFFNYSNHYYQKRFHSTEAQDSVKVKDYLKEYEINQSLENLFNLNELYERHFIKLSNGQTRKVRLAKALSKNPKLLILDDPFSGLDEKSRNDLGQIIESLSKSGTQIILITNRNDLPDFITHVLEIENFKIKSAGLKVEFLENKRLKHSEKEEDSLIKLLELLPISNENFETAVSLKNVTIQYDEKVVLKNINWNVKKGEKWALLGPNGAGKSTLLSLITGDNPQAYSQEIALFDRKKGTGESIWEVKKRIGFLSPEFHLYFRSNTNGYEIASTGFTDTVVLTRNLKEEEAHLVHYLFSYFGVLALEEKPFLQMSVGQQRLVLFIRAVIKNPAILILDEPFQGMDTDLINKCRKVLELFSQNSKTIIFVTHIKEEIPDFVDKVFFLKDGIQITG